jgi:hypothetical protein
LTRIVAAAAVLWLIAAGTGGQVPPAAAAWQDAPAYLPLFAPSGPRAAAYDIYVSRLSIDKVLELLATNSSFLHPPGAWVQAALLPADAFGQTGGYDRSKLARLYGSKPAVVARGPRGTSGRPTEAWTLISPYPASDMTRLEAGTMLIILSVEFP